VTADGQFVLVGDNANNLMAIDIAACRKVAKGAACEAALRVPFDGQLGASFVATPDNRIFVSAGGVHAFDLSRDADGNLIAEHRWTHDTIPLVITGFENIVYFPSREGHLVGLDPDNGQVLFDQPGGLGANVTMASDLRTLITNQINFGQKPPAGVWGWRTPD
jgi:outer membrane protein assembly factor BamB